MTLLDADAVALEAAAINVPAATRCLSDGWSGLSSTPRHGYDTIVSNPPVHCGTQQDFSVLRRLVVGASERLRPGGTLWIVAQEYIPVGAMLARTKGLPLPHLVPRLTRLAEGMLHL